MKRFGHYALLALWILLAAAEPSGAVSCKTKCDKKCRVRGPFGTSWTDPGCLVDCEVKKKAACAIKRDVPSLPGSPSEVPEVLNRVTRASCAVEFETVAQSVILDCGRFRAPNRSAEVADRAMEMLIELGVVSSLDARNVSVRFCDLRGSVAGVVPDRNTIILDLSYDPTAAEYDSTNLGMVGLGALLAHEMVHVDQYRRLGTDEFKCQYVERYKQCWGCQDDRHSLEGEGYAREEAVFRSLENRLRYSSCHPWSGGVCERPGSYFGEPCQCYDQWGRAHPGLIAW
jgi:hypothetical protein